MFLNGDIPKNRQMLGFYELRGDQYLNKYHALQNCAENEWPHWNFHDDAFSKVDWSIEPKDDLYDLYLQRAIQIRSKYDNLILFYSGGIDSHTILNVFAKNNIKLDAVIVSGSYSIDNTIETTCNQEQRRVAHNYLDELRKNGFLKHTQVIYMDTVDFHKEFAQTDESWVYQCGTSITPQVYTYNHYWQDPRIQAIMDSGHTAIMRGIDKPRVILKDGNWYTAFLDVHIMSGTPTGMLDKKQNWDIQEYFFWTPDFPRILQKQAHVLIRWFEENLTQAEAQALTTNEATFKRSTYNNYIDPIVYYQESRQEIGKDKDYYSLGKPAFTNLWHKDYWFFKANDQFGKEIQTWEAGLRHLKESTPDHVWNKTSDAQANKLNNLMGSFGLNNNLTDVANILEGCVGSWSKFHFIKKAKFTES